MTILDRLQKARLEVNTVINDGRRALYAIDKAIEEADIEPDPTPTPTPTPPQNPDPEPDPVPDPEPDPLPEPPPVREGGLSTNTGSWPVEILAGGYKIGDEHFVWREPTEASAITDAPTPLAGIPFTCLEGALKFEGRDLVAPDPDRLIAAVKAGRVLPYSLAAFDGWARAPGWGVERRPNGGNITYRVDRIYGKSSSSNALGIIDGQGSEQSSSRGFLAGDDCQFIAAALAGNKEAWDDLLPVMRSGMLYGLSIPNFAIWSGKHNRLRDPQIGDEPYFNEGTRRPNFGNDGRWTCPADYPHAAEIAATPGSTYAHGQNQEHLFNHGFAYWLATGDPRAAILQQAIAAYAIASEWRGKDADGTIRGRVGYQRATANMWSAAWKLRDVALHAAGDLLWPAETSLAYANQIIDDWESAIAEVDAGTDASSVMLRLLGSIDGASGYGISNFMTQGYGPESAYLWASAGRPKMLERIARQMVVRFGLIGGTRGVYGTASGSAFGARAVSGGPIEYSTLDGLVAYVNANSDYPADSFDGAAQHTVQRAYWLLRMAKDAEQRGWIAPVEGVSMAIERMEAARAVKAPTKDLSVVGWKHAGVNF